MSHKESLEGYIPVPGGKVWYHIWGSDQSNIPLMVLHGGPGAPHYYLEPLELLAGQRPVIFYDQLGCGTSDKPDDLSLWKVERFIDELVAVLKALDLNEVHLLGQGWGSTLAIEYMLREKPEHVCSLVLSGPFLSASRWIADQHANLALMPENIQNIVKQAELTGNFNSLEYQQAMNEYYKRHICRLKTWPEAMNRTLEQLSVPVYMTMNGPSEFTMIGSLKDIELVSRLREISIPVLFTCGRYDAATPETTAFYQKALPGSEMVVFEDASSEHHLEKTEEYLGVVRNFLERVEQTK